MDRLQRHILFLLENNIHKPVDSGGRQVKPRAHQFIHDVAFIAENPFGNQFTNNSAFIVGAQAIIDNSGDHIPF